MSKKVDYNNVYIRTYKMYDICFNSFQKPEILPIKSYHLFLYDTIELSLMLLNSECDNWWVKSAKIINLYICDTITYDFLEFFHKVDTDL